MFYCERYRCSLEERHCVAYQEAIRGREFATIHCGGTWGSAELTIGRENCVGCAQGAAIAAAYGPVLRPAGLPRRSGDIPPQEANKEDTMPRNTCMIEGCGKKVAGQGLCGPHYDKWRRGDPAVVKAKGAEFKVVRPLKPRNKAASVPAETKPAKTETKQPSGSGNGQIQVPEFEAKILYALARKTGGTVSDAFLRCLRRGLEHELGLL